MSGPREERELHERLREAAALGDLEEVRRLLQSGADVNSPNEVNGWTCLHWACKRNHAEVVSYLIDAGADKEILTTKGELAAQLTSKKEIRKIMGVEENEFQKVEDLNLPIVANYLANPPFPYIYTKENSSIPSISTASQNESTSVSSVSLCETSPCSSATQVKSICTPTSSHSEDSFPVARSKEDQPTPSGDIMVPEYPKPRVQNGSICQPSMSHNRGLFSPVASKQPVPQQQNGSHTGAAPTFQPLFFTGTFPYNMQELVLKVRIQNLRENDFIEIELDRQELTYQDLLRVSCCELGVNQEQVEKIRKLPNTLVRKDKDVARLQDFQELELVLMKSDNSPFRNAASALTERSCYNSKASKLTY
ncbi:ankyrin repeat domain-containing protein 40-like isoform X1 [Chelonoidis abingdonii]|uniref:Ankyrin repeat domain-containing protein 40 n=1 Tax=Chelonoidis abingdonii TaxID=106734 RepID=A0A8C0ISG0_CHEAB|nr:ankyrin repeat domain-containing protein 40-like isoform X1 [Chelonoidis abingdonii]